MTTKRILSVLLGLVLLAGCNTSNKKPAEVSDLSSTTIQTYTVEISAMKFNPDTLYVQKGDSIVFINKGIVNHNVTAPDSSWTSGPIPVGSQWGMTVTKDTPYYCSIHIIMKGIIYLK